MNILQSLAEEYMGKETGYVYVMEYRFKSKGNYKTLYKIGITRNEPIDRMLQVSRSFFQIRRYVPESRLVRMRKVPSFMELESKLHTIYKEFNYSFNFKFDGSTEFFDMDLDKLLDGYDDLVPLKGKR